MKKFKFMLLALAATAMIFTSCNEKENDDDNKTNTENNQGGNQGGNQGATINWQENGNTLVGTLVSYDEDVNSQVNARIFVTFGSDGKAVSGTVSATYPDAATAQRAYQEIMNDLDDEDDPSVYTISGSTITLDVTDMVEGKNREQVRAIMERMFGTDDDDDDNGGNNQGGQGSSDINGTYMMYSFADETYQGADVVYVVVVMDGYISFVRDIDFEGEDNDQQVTFVGTYSYQNGQYVAMMHEEHDTTDFRFTFTVNDDEMSFTYSGRTIVLSKDEVDK